MTWPFPGIDPLSCDVIVADPPWEFELWSEAGQSKAPQAHYDCMSLAAIKAFPVSQVARGDCLLMLWTTGWAMANGFATEVVNAWGFKPISEIVWRKITRNGRPRMGPGYRVRTMHEPIILATIGNPPHKPFPSEFAGVAREHSRKPDEFYEMVRRHTLSAVRRVDLFSGGHDRPGFVGVGAPHRSVSYKSEQVLNAREDEQRVLFDAAVALDDYLMTETA